METKIFLFAATLLASSVASSCSNELSTEIGTTPEAVGKAHIKLICHATPSAKQIKRAALTANGKNLTDLYIFDYDKTTGALLQVLHQTATAADFAEPDLTLDYGAHTLKVIATRSDQPQLLDADNEAWTLAPNVLTAITTTAPAALTSSKTSDTFGAQQDITVGVGQASTVSITLDRLVAKLVINSTDDFPSDCSTWDVALNEYTAISCAGFSVIEPLKNHRITSVANLAGKTGTTITYFLLTPTEGYTTDITFTTNRTSGAPYSTITVENVPLERNKVTTITGSFYNHQQGFAIGLNDEWSDDGHAINI